MAGSKEGPTIIIEVQVQPKSSRDEITAYQSGRIKIRVTAPPEGGKANERLKEIIAEEFGVSKSGVEIVKGQKSRLKIIKISGISQGEYDSFVKRLTD
ncbi:MAG TPA: DUF167 domain-containing protein [Thermodesulfobacteriota bacterium]|nr:DUF167 domain-containing protein [Thermodesulfobacteriota bacterium]